MAEDKMMRLSQVARILNVGITTIVEHLSANGTKVESNPNTKINSANIEFLSKEFSSAELRSFLTTSKADTSVKFVAEEDKGDQHKSDFDEILYFRGPSAAGKPEELSGTEQPKPDKEDIPRIEPVKLPGITVVGKVELDKKGNVIEPFKKEEPKAEPAQDVVKPQEEKAEPVQQPKEIEKPVEVHKVEAEPELIAPPKQEPEKVVEAVKVEVEPPVVTEQSVVKKEEEIAPEAPVKVPDAKETVVRIKTEPKSERPKETQQPEPVSPPVGEAPADMLIEAKGEQLKGLTVIGKIELPVDRGRKKEGNDANRESDKSRKRKRKRIRGEVKVEGTPATTNPKGPATSGSGPVKPKEGAKPAATGTTPGAAKPDSSGGHKNTGFKRRERKEQVSEKEVSDNIKATMARLGGPGVRSGRGKTRRRDRTEQEDFNTEDSGESKILRVTEFISANDLALLMEVSVQEVISVCMNMGMFVSINQRLDAEAITFIADEFGYEVAFISAEEDVQNDILTEEDREEDLIERAPIVTIMGHVDHGKTSLLDYIRKANVAGGEAGGITQHIGAYNVKTKTGKQVTFLDTPGHEAFTAMRARGAKETDVVIIVIAADDSVMPQTREAINHAQVAGVPIVFAFSKVDKAGANTEKVREELAQMNLLVEEWGGKYQTQEISSKSGLGIDELLEKVLLEAEMLELKANPKKRATGTVIEASLDKGRGYMSTLLVESGTMKIGDFILAGAHFGRVKAMADHRGNRLKEVGPSMPVLLLGLNGAPQAGDKFNVMENERDARDIANKREQIQREQTMRTRKHITLEEIGRRKAIGSFRELNLIVKGDVDGSVEALSDSLLQLSTQEVQVNIIHKAVGQISESDVNLAIASDAIIVGFQVRPSSNAKKMAEQEQIEIRHYSVIYSAIEEIKDAMTGMLAPTVEEVVTGNIEIREIFKISRIGTIAGCYVLDGFVKRNNKIRIIRDGIVVHTGEIDSLKRFKDDVGEVRTGYEFGLSVKNFNDIEVGDIIESFEFKEVKRTL